MTERVDIESHALFLLFFNIYIYIYIFILSVDSHCTIYIYIYLLGGGNLGLSKGIRTKRSHKSCVR